jgi:cytochrome c556
MDIRSARPAAVALIAVSGLLATPLAQQRPPQQQQQQQQQQQKPQTAPPPAGRGGAAPAPGTPPKPLVPLAASTVAAHPDPYYGEYVTITASVDQIMSPSTFSLDQDATKSTGKDVLVVVPTMTGKVDQNAYVTVIGELVKFDPAEIEKKTKDKKYTLDLPADAAAKYAGKPVVIATSVINAGFVDVAKRLPPPMTGEEENYQKLMKKIQPAFGALRTAVDKSDVDATTEQATALKEAFAETEAFWKAKGKNEPMQWAADARKQTEAILHDLPLGNWNGIKTQSAAVGQSCGTCHNAYRERFDDGSFRIKMQK